MKFGSIETSKWEQPTKIILFPLSKLITFLLPTKTEWKQQNKSINQIIYIGNENTYRFDSLTLITEIYLHTQKWPRIIVDDLNFKIPVWKHLIEYFGAVRNQSDTIKTLSKLDHPFIIYPNRNKLTELDENLKNFKIIPFSSLGASDMVKNS
jgi:hypothetical protein